jgi:hypothetical protein
LPKSTSRLKFPSTRVKKLGSCLVQNGFTVKANYLKNRFCHGCCQFPRIGTGESISIPSGHRHVSRLVRFSYGRKRTHDLETAGKPKRGNLDKQRIVAERKMETNDSIKPSQHWKDSHRRLRRIEVPFPIQLLAAKAPPSHSRREEAVVGKDEEALGGAKVP